MGPISQLSWKRERGGDREMDRERDRERDRETERDGKEVITVSNELPKIK